MLYSAGATNPRQEILLQIDPLERPRGNRTNSSPFDNRVQAGIRSGRWKLIVGNPGKCRAGGSIIIMLTWTWLQSLDVDAR
jgi:hypothetical protein